MRQVRSNLKAADNDSVWDVFYITMSALLQKIHRGELEIQGNGVDEILARLQDYNVYVCQNTPCYAGDDIILFYDPNTKKSAFVFDGCLRFVKEEFTLDQAFEAILQKGENDHDYTTE